MQFSLRGMLLGIAEVALCLGMGLYLGILGIAIVFDAWLLVVVILKTFGVRRIAGLPVPKLTILEWCSIGIVAVMLHALLLPNVDTRR